MQFVKPGVPFVFSYQTYDLNYGLYVRAKIYDVTSGSAIFVDNVNMTHNANGTYNGVYTPNNKKVYLVISAVYDSSYTTLDSDRSPSADTYKSVDAEIGIGTCVFGAYDESDSLFVGSNVYDLTTGTPVLVDQITLDHVFAGVYFGSFTGQSDHVYQITSLVYTSSLYVTVNVNRAPGNDYYQLTPSVINVMSEAVLSGQETIAHAGTTALKVTQGDTVTFQFIAESGDGIPFDITGANFTTYFRGSNGSVISFGNSHHMINPDQVNYPGQFSLTLNNDETATIPVGLNKEIITKISQTDSIIYFHGPSLVTILSPIPEA